jgi:uncharacterized protein YfaS (alpha-2-macroglobulin family)
VKRRTAIEEKESRSQDLVSAGEPALVSFDPGPAGRYRIRASVSDDRGRRAESELTCWVSGKAEEPSYRGLVDARLRLEPDKSEYRPGDTARILLKASFYPAEGRTTLVRSGILRTERFVLESPSIVIEVPIEESHVPNLWVLIDLVGSTPRLGEGGKPDPGLPPRPARAFGYLELKVPPATRTLSLDVKPREPVLRPGGETVVDLRARDAKGQPAEGAEVCLYVVDDAVLALSGYRPPDPLQSFYQERDPWERSGSLRVYLDERSPANASAALRAWRHPSGPSLALPDIGGGGPRAPIESVTLEPPGAKGRQKISLRSDLSALALFVASALTKPDGTAQVPLKLPGNVTRYKIFAAAAGRDGRSFGTAEGSLVARLPLIVRPSPPRFLYSGDRFELPVLVQNGTEKPVEVDVAVRGASSLEWTGPTARRVAVPGDGRVEVHFSGAASRAGAAPIQVGAVAADLVDAAQVNVPVQVPLTLEAFAAYFEVEAAPIAQPLLAPAGAREDFGGLEIETSSTVLQTLSDAYVYLSEYPYGCAEQISSRVLAAAGLGEALRAFSREARPAEVQAAVKADLEQLASFQNEDGGFGFWPERRSDPYVSVHAAHAIAVAKAAGFGIPEKMRESALKYLRDIQKRIPKEYVGPARRALEAYALHVTRKLDPEAGPAAAETLARARELARGSLEDLPPEAAAWILPILSADPGSRLEVDSLRKRISNCVEETAGLAHFEFSYPEGGQRLLEASRRADAVILDALLDSDPGSDLIPKLVRGLLAHRLHGRWSTTQENVFALLALGKYFERAEAEPPDFVARAWLSGRQILEERFAGRSDEWRQMTIPMSFLAGGEAREILLAREGRGRLYVRLGLRAAPSSLERPPVDQGIALARAYEAVDDPVDVRREKEGVWKVRAGSRVRVRVGVETLSRRHHVALVDPIPAGFEIENPWLRGWQTPPRAAEAIPRFPADHQNLRDDRAEVFTSVLEEGCYAFIYTARATTRGTFVAPPSRAEEMYHPETCGRGRVDIVVVE